MIRSPPKELLTEAHWAYGRMGDCMVTSRRSPGGVLGHGVWATGYEIPDYGWRELDRNAGNVVWECVKEGEYYQCVSRPSSRAEELTPALLKDWRCELGVTGYRVRYGGADWRPSSDFVAREPAPLPQNIEPTTTSPLRWPTREQRIATLALEMQTPLAERILKVRG